MNALAFQRAALTTSALRRCFESIKPQGAALQALAPMVLLWKPQPPRCCFECISPQGAAFERIRPQGVALKASDRARRATDTPDKPARHSPENGPNHARNTGQTSTPLAENTPETRQSAIETFQKRVRNKRQRTGSVGPCVNPQGGALKPSLPRCCCESISPQGAALTTSAPTCCFESISPQVLLCKHQPPRCCFASVSPPCVVLKASEARPTRPETHPNRTDAGPTETVSTVRTQSMIGRHARVLAGWPKHAPKKQGNQAQNAWGDKHARVSAHWSPKHPRNNSRNNKDRTHITMES